MSVRKLNIVEAMAPKWRNIAILLGLTENQIDIIKDRGSGKTLSQCLDEVLKVWREGKMGGSVYPYTWEGLLELLEDVDLSVTASNLKNALSSEKSTVKSNKDEDCQCLPLDLLKTHSIHVYELLDVDAVYPSLCEEGLLDDREKRKLTKYGRTRESKTIKLLKILPQKGPDAVSRFVKCLRETGTNVDHVKLADILSTTGAQDTPNSGYCGFDRTNVMGIVAFAVISLLVFTFVQYPGVLNFFNQYQSKSLPYPSKVFVGREKEMDKLITLLDFHSDDDIRIVNIVGSPGFGKSTLAIHFGHYMVQQGIIVHYINVAEYKDQDVHAYIAKKILDASGDDSTTFSFDILLNQLREYYWNCLIIIDDCDDVLQSQKEPFFQALKKMVEQSTSIKILVTSREHTTRLEYFTRYPVFELSTQAACELLEKKTNLTNSEVQEIARLTGNVPLALHIIGALLTSPNPPSPARVIKELKTRPIPILSHEDIPQASRINVSISLSYKYLSSNVQDISCYLAHFPGSFDYFAAMAILDMNLEQMHYNTPLRFLLLGTELESNVSSIRTTLNSLVSRSLIEYDPQSDRYKFHRLIKEFFRELQSIKSNVKLTSNFQYCYSFLLIDTIKLFETNYKKALLDLHTERHNYKQILEYLPIKNHDIHSFLQMSSAISNALQNGKLLTVYFSDNEIFPSLESAVAFIVEKQLLKGPSAYSTESSMWHIHENIYTVYITLLSELMSITAKLYGTEKAALSFKRQEDQIHIIQSKYPWSSHIMFYTILADLYENLGNPERARKCHETIVCGERKDKCNIHFSVAGTWVCTCSDHTIGEAYMSQHNYKGATKFFKLSYMHERSTGIEKFVLLVKAYFKLGNLKEADKYAQEMATMLETKSTSLTTSNIYASRSVIGTVIADLRLLKQPRIADSLETKLLEATMEIESQRAPESACSRQKEIVEYYYKIGQFNVSIHLGKTFARNLKKCSLPSTIIIIKTEIIISKALFRSGKFSQAMDKMEELVPLTMPYSILYENELSEICLYLIPRLRYITTCYPWVTSIPFKAPGVLIYFTFAVPPIHPQQPFLQHSFSRSQPKSTFPELERFKLSEETAVATTKEFELNDYVKVLPQYTPFSITMSDDNLKAIFRDSIVWFHDQYYQLHPLNRFLVNVLLVVARLYFLCLLIFLSMFIPLVIAMLTVKPVVFVLAYLILAFPKYFAFPPVIAATTFLLKFIAWLHYIDLYIIARFVVGVTGQYRLYRTLRAIGFNHMVL